MTIIVGDRHKAFDFEPSQVVHHIFRVRAYVAHAVRDAGEFGVGAPHGEVFRLSLLFGRELVDEPILRIFGDDGRNLADFAVRNHLLHHLGHNITRVGIGDGEDKVLFRGEFFELFRLFDRKAQRLFAHDVDARKQELFCHFVMQEVGGADGHEIYLVRTLCFRRGHFFVILIGALRRNAVRLCGVRVFGLYVGEASRNEFRPRVERQRLAVNFADKRVYGAAYHSVFDFLCHNFPPSEISV